MIKTRKRKWYDKFPTTNKYPQKGDIWLAKFPYQTRGNIEKLRPVLISHANEEKEIFICRMITTNRKKGDKIVGFLEKYFPRTSYITRVYEKLTIDKLYRRIYASKGSGKSE